MKLTKTNSFKIKLLIITIAILFVLYTFRKEFFFSFPCKHLYNIDSFQTCALSNTTCNVTLLFNSYLAYRTCVMKHSSTGVDYVVFDAVNGLGNRILGLVAVTTYALVTNRVLLINWQPGDNHQTYFEELFFPLSSSEKIPFHYKYSLSRLTNLIKNRWINEIEWETKTSSIPRDWAFYFDREILCNNQIYRQTWFRQFGFAIFNFFSSHLKWIRTDQYFVPLLARNEQTREAFTALFRNGQVFTELSRRLLRPVKKVNAIIEDFHMRNNLKNKYTTIGVHMRSWSPKMISHTEPFERCIEYVMQNISRLVTSQTKIYLYAISNTPKRRQQLQNRISEMYENVEILHPPEAPAMASAIERMQYTLAELILLSKMQHLIITSKSTFGMVAQGLVRQGAWIVRQGVFNDIKGNKSDSCQWESSSEPEYQMMGSLQINDTCSQHGASLPSIGERTVL